MAHLQAEHDLAGLSLDTIRVAVDRGLGEAERGQFVNFTAEDVIAERRAALAARLKGM